MSYWRVEPEWCGESVAILGCGPSRAAVDVALLREHCDHVIAINDSFRVAPWADILYFCDLKWWTTRGSDVQRVFRGRIVTLENEIPGVLRLHNSGATGLDPDPTCLRHGSNSGYQTIHLAYHLGAMLITLVGYDMRIVDGRMHAEHRPERQSTREFAALLHHAMLPKFDTIAQPLADAGVQVINATPGSALTIWPIVDTAGIVNALSRRGK
jgi:hypothetical protein